MFYYIDIDECESDNAGCSHNCHNTPGGYYCSCQPGFHLKNSHFCTGQQSQYFHSFRLYRV